MILGLKRGTVELFDHDKGWENRAERTIRKLRAIFGPTAEDIQHVGSTAIFHIKSKPIIDIVVAVKSLDSVESLMPVFLENGWAKSIRHQVEGEMLLVDDDPSIRTHHIHIVLAGSPRWTDYISFRDYLNTNVSAASEYEALKVRSAKRYHDDRNGYTSSKSEIIERILQKARIWSHFGRELTEILPIERGWSEDRKYRVTKKDGSRFMLRISPIRMYGARKDLFQVSRRIHASGIPIPHPVDFGTFTDGVFSLHTWVEGRDLEEVLLQMPEREQYMMGYKAGEILRSIHEIPAPENQEDWSPRFNRKIDLKIEKYKKCGLRFEGDDKIISYLEGNRVLVEGRPQCFQHGDYHVGNMMCEKDELVILDFDRCDFGDPWEEFNRIVWCAKVSPAFAKGRIHGYFRGEPPDSFWHLLKFYVAGNTLSSIYWAIPFGVAEVSTMMEQSQDVLSWYDNMRSAVPEWYLKDSDAY